MMRVKQEKWPWNSSIQEIYLISFIIIHGLKLTWLQYYTITYMAEVESVSTSTLPRPPCPASVNQANKHTLKILPCLKYIKVMLCRKFFFTEITFMT